jgi:primosomal protein N'
MASYREAELAIRELDSVPPFYFKVKFARSASEKERIRRQREDDEMLSRAVESEPYPVQSERSPFDSFSR